MRPPQEGFDADDAPVAGPDDRLVLHAELATPTGATQVALQACALLDQALLAEVDELVAGAALALRLVHGEVSVVEDLLGEMVAPSRQRDADAGGRVHVTARQDEQVGEPGADPRGDGIDLRSS